MADETEHYLLKRGAQLRYPLHDLNGVLLLAAGAEVTHRLRRLLDQRGIRIVLKATLEVIEGQPLGMEIPIKGEWITIGRRPECDVRLDSRIVSGHHCRVYHRSSGIFVRDLKSTNGTFVDGQRVLDECEVVNDSKLRVGAVLFQVHVFAAMAADDATAQREIDEWLLAEPTKKGPPQEPTLGPTMPIVPVDLSRRDEIPR